MLTNLSDKKNYRSATFDEGCETIKAQEAACEGSLLCFIE